MSTNSHVPSSVTAADGFHHLLRMRHVVDAVERGDDIDAVIRRTVECSCGSWKLALVTAAPRSFSGSRCNARRDVVSDEGRSSETRLPSTGRRYPHHTRCRRHAPAVKRSTTPSSAGNTVGIKNALLHGSKLRSIPTHPRNHGCRSRSPVRSRSCRAPRRTPWSVSRWNIPIPNAGCSGVGEDRLGFHGQREPLFVVDFDQFCCSLVVCPLANPTLVQSGPLGEIGRAQWHACGLHRREAELIPEVDHAGCHRAIELGEHEELHHREAVPVDCRHRLTVSTCAAARFDTFDRHGPFDLSVPLRRRQAGPRHRRGLRDGPGHRAPVRRRGGPRRRRRPRRGARATPWSTRSRDAHGADAAVGFVTDVGEHDALPSAGRRGRRRSAASTSWSTTPASRWPTRRSGRGRVRRQLGSDVDVNLTAHAHLSASPCRTCAEPGEGRVVNIASTEAIVTTAGMAAYTATKAGWSG